MAVWTTKLSWRTIGDQGTHAMTTGIKFKLLNLLLLLYIFSGVYVINVIESSVEVPKMLSDTTCQEFEIFHTHFTNCFQKLLNKTTYSEFIHGPKIFTVCK